MILSATTGSIRIETINWADFTDGAGGRGTLTIRSNNISTQVGDALGSGTGAINVVIGDSLTPVAGAAFTISNQNITVNNLDGNTLGKISGSGRTLTIGAANGTNTNFLGIIDAGVSITKTGNGTQTISGAFLAGSGAVNVSAGTLVLGASNAYVGTTNVTGGTLRVGNSNALGGAQSANLTTTSGSNSAIVDSATNLFVGQLIVGTNVPVGTYISALSGTTVTLSQNASGSGTAATTFAGVTKVSGSGSLDLNGQSISEPFGNTISDDGFAGTGTGGNGVLINTGTATAIISGNIYTNATNGLGTGTNGFVIGSGDIALTGRIDRRNGGVGGMGIQKIGTGTLTIGGTASNGAFNDLWLNDGTAVLAKSGNAVAVSNVTINGGTLKMDPNNISTNTNAWQGQIGNGLTFGAGGGTWDLNDTAGVNNRLKGVSGTTGTITNTGTGAALLTFGMRDNNALWSFSGTITDGTNGGTVAVTTSYGGFGSGQVQILGGRNSYSGGTTIGYGTVRVGNNNALGTGTATVSAGATLDVDGYSPANVVAAAGTGAGGNGAIVNNNTSTTSTLTGVINNNFTISGSGNITLNFATSSALTKTGSGTVTFINGGVGTISGGLTINGGLVVLSQTTGQYLNTLTLNSGTLRMDPANQVASTQAWSGQVQNTVTMNGGVWDLNDSGTNGVNNRFKSISGTGGAVTNSGTATAQFTFGLRDSGTSDWSGSITDGTNGGIVQLVFNDTNAGSRVQILSGSSSYSGGTTINDLRASFLRMGNDHALSTGTVTFVYASANIDLNGHTLGNPLNNNGATGMKILNSAIGIATVSTGFNQAGVGAIQSATSPWTARVTSTGRAPSGGQACRNDYQEWQQLVDPERIEYDYRE